MFALCVPRGRGAGDAGASSPRRRRVTTIFFFRSLSHESSAIASLHRSVASPRPVQHAPRSASPHTRLTAVTHPPSRSQALRRRSEVRQLEQARRSQSFVGRRRRRRRRRRDRDERLALERAARRLRRAHSATVEIITIRRRRRRRRRLPRVIEPPHGLAEETETPPRVRHVLRHFLRHFLRRAFQRRARVASRRGARSTRGRRRRRAPPSGRRNLSAPRAPSRPKIGRRPRTVPARDHVLSAVRGSVAVDARGARGRHDGDRRAPRGGRRHAGKRRRRLVLRPRRGRRASAHARLRQGVRGGGGDGV